MGSGRNHNRLTRINIQMYVKNDTSNLNHVMCFYREHIALKATVFRTYYDGAHAVIFFFVWEINFSEKMPEIQKTVILWTCLIFLNDVFEVAKC